MTHSRDRREVELARAEAGPRPEGERDAFDPVVADLPRRWREDGHGDGVETWEEQSDIEKIGYLARYAAEHQAPFFRFVEAAGRTLGREDGQEFTAEELHHLRQQFRWAHGDFSAAGDADTRHAGSDRGGFGSLGAERRAIAAYDAEVAGMTRGGPGEESGSARAWRAASERGRLGLLADLAMDHGVEQEVFVRRAGRALGWPEPTAEQRGWMADAWARAMDADRGPGPPDASFAAAGVRNGQPMRELSVDDVRVWYRQNRRPDRGDGHERSPSPADLVERARPTPVKQPGAQDHKPKL